MMGEYHVCLSIECIMMDENLGLLDQNTSFEGQVFSIEKMVQNFSFDSHFMSVENVMVCAI
jgi:hypothetical protein